MKKMSPPELLSFVRHFDPVARICDDGSAVQIVSPRLDKGGRFIRLYVEFDRPGRMLLHDDAYTLSARVDLSGLKPAEILALLSPYGLDSLRDPRGRLQTWLKKPEDYAERREQLENAILHLTAAYGRPLARSKPALTLVKAPAGRS